MSQEVIQKMFLKSHTHTHTHTHKRTYIYIYIYISVMFSITWHQVFDALSEHLPSVFRVYKTSDKNKQSKYISLQ